MTTGTGRALIDTEGRPVPPLGGGEAGAGAVRGPDTREETRGDISVRGRDQEGD